MVWAITIRGGMCINCREVVEGRETESSSEPVHILIYDMGKGLMYNYGSLAHGFMLAIYFSLYFLAARNSFSNS